MLNTQNSYKKQWATVFVLFYGPNTISVDDVSKLLTPILNKDWILKEKPIVFSSNYPQIKQKFSTGPWKGRDTTNKGPILTSVKWNIRRKDDKIVSDTDLGNIRANYREKIVPLLTKIGLSNEYIAARSYGTAFDKTVDKGLPKNPPIPPEPMNKLWLLIGASVVGLFVIKKIISPKQTSTI